jgi:hypothetical protein
MASPSRFRGANHHCVVGHRVARRWTVSGVVLHSIRAEHEATPDDRWLLAGKLHLAEQIARVRVSGYAVVGCAAATVNRNLVEAQPQPAMPAQKAHSLFVAIDAEGTPRKARAVECEHPETLPSPVATQRLTVDPGERPRVVPTPESGSPPLPNATPADAATSRAKASAQRRFIRHALSQFNDSRDLIPARGQRRRFIVASTRSSRRALGDAASGSWPPRAAGS